MKRILQFLTMLPALIFALVLCNSCEDASDEPDVIIIYTVSFESNGGSTISDIEVENGSMVSKPTDPTKVEETFVDWYSDSALTQKWSFDTLITEDITLYAKWSINQYTITFDSNNGSEVANQNVDYNSTATEPTEPTRTGYTFDDWYSDSALTQKWSFDTLITEDVTLYASWITTLSIYNLDDFIKFRDSVNGGDKTIIATLMCDIDLGGIYWTPIGVSEEQCYSGEFNGNGFSISNLTIITDDSYQGLFGYLKGGSIQDVNLHNTSINGAHHIGAVSGFVAGDCIVTNCDVIDGVVSGLSEVGGIVGYTQSSIVSCYNSAEIISSGSAGGIAGGASTIYGCVTESFIDCRNTGSVSGDKVTWGTGGIVGDIYDFAIISCCNEGNVLSGTGYAGGIFGSSSWTSSTAALVKDCYNTGIVTGNNCSGGGIAGYSSTNISDCYNTGSIFGGEGAGGIVGSSSANITSCYNNGDILGIGGTGGILGSCTTSVVTACYNTGVVCGGGSTGGIVGITHSEIIACYNNGAVSGSSNNYVGGVVGRLYSSTAAVKNCYNISKVTNGELIGGIVGYYPPSYTPVTDCFYQEVIGITYDNDYGTVDNDIVSTMHSNNIISILNAAAEDNYWKYDSNNINNGYPILVSIDY